MSTSVRQIKNRPKKVTVKTILRSKKRKTRLQLLILAAVFIALSLILKGNTNNLVIPAEPTKAFQNVVSFSEEPVDIDKKLLDKVTKNTKKETPKKIFIPDIAVDVKVDEAEVIAGYWEVFPDKAGWGIGSAYPGERGNQVIFAHAREGLFLPLKNAENGQKIYIFTADKWYLYEIYEIRQVTPSQTEVIASTDEEILTLYTCSGFSDEKRLIVQAKRIE